MIYSVVSLVLLFSVLLVGVSFTQNSYAVNHSFELEWGSSGHLKPGMFLNPQHLAVDSENNIYVTDLGNSRVQKFDDQGNHIRSWGSQGSGPGEFSHPSGIAVANEYVFVVDNILDTVQKFDSFGNFVIQWGGSGDGNGEFRSPNGIAISDDEFIYVVDTGNNRIQKFTFDGEYVLQFGQSGKKSGNFITPIDIAVDEAGKLFVTDPGNNRINVYDENGKFLRALDSSIGGFRIGPSGIIFDKSNNFYIADQKNSRIIQLNEFGFSSSIFGMFGSDKGQFQLPMDVTVDNDGFLYVTDTLSHKIQKFSTPLVTEKLIIENEEIIQEPQIEQPETITESEVIEPEIELPPVTPIPNDFTKPVIIVPDDIIIEATGGLTSVDIGQATADDESGIRSLSNNAAESFPLGITTVIWTAIDGSGNMAIESQQVVIQDTTPPEVEMLPEIILEAKSVTQNLVQLETPSVSDAVGVISIENDAPEVFSLGETIVNWTVTDVMRNISTIQQQVTLIDSTSPRVDIPEDIIIEASSINENEVLLIDPEVFDEVKIQSLSNDAPENFPLGETIVTWMVSDSSGNIATSSQKVIVVDTTAPYFLLNPITLEATTSSGADTVLEIPQINDIQDVSITNDAPDVFPFGETIVTWVATDQSGNQLTQTQSVNVIDTKKPIILVPSDMEIEAIGIDTKIDDLGELITEDISEIDYVSNDAPESFPLGETVVTWTATDTSGNTASDTQQIIIEDTIQPVITGPENIILEITDVSGMYVDIGKASALDQVDNNPRISNDAPVLFQLGDTIVTWTAIDSSANIALFFQTISVIDTVAPEIIPPENIIKEAENQLSNFVDLGDPETSDIVDIFSISNDAPESFPLGETVVTWTATDTSGNTASDTQLITVLDTTAPSIDMPENIVMEATGLHDNIVNLDTITADDNVGVILITNDAPPMFDLGVTIVSWTISDNAGNAATAQQQVSLVDTTIPTITSPNDIQIEAISKNSNIIEIGIATAFDIIQLGEISNDAPESFPLGETVVTWTATDTSGNTASDTQLITVLDTTAPSISQLEDIIVDATSPTSNVVELTSPISGDIISDVIINNNAPNAFPFGETVVTWSAEDESGNISYTDHKVIVVDNSPPELTPSPDMVIDAVSLENFIEINLPEISDIIDTQPIITNDAPELFPLGETVVTWTATDTSGNSVSETQLISVQICGNSPSYYNFIMGTAEDDFLTGTSLPDLIFGDGGDDIIIGNNGNDCIFAGEGNDIVFGNSGDDSITGGQGNDVIKGDSGEDILSGGVGLDMIDGGDDIDTCLVIEEQNSDLVVKCETIE